MAKEVKLSASRLKTAKKCSWYYWSNYFLKLPEKKNDGASRGDICHIVFECLGRKDRKPIYDKIVKENDVFCVPSIARLINKKAKNHEIFDKDNLESINKMILAGLNYDFFGTKLGKPTKSYSEYEFDLKIEKDGKYYRIKGFIDKLFLYKKKKIALIRDFKSSKNVFEGKDLSENFQDLIYKLAIRHCFPEYKNILTEFVFLKFDLSSGDESKGLIKIENTSNEDLDFFENKLIEGQRYLENFNEKTAKSNYAWNKTNITKEDGFAGKMVCGFAKYKGEPKKDGNPKWSCPFKFGFDYYALYDENNNFVMSSFCHEYFLLAQNKKEGYTIKKLKYDGCPTFNSSF